MTERLGAGYRLAIGVLRPLLMVGTRRDWHGGENLPPTGGFVIASNHVSHVDPIVISHFLIDNGRHPRFLAKASLFTVPFVGWVVRSAGQIPVFRESKNAAAAFAGAVTAVEAGECVTVYPEGTLTRDPALWPMVAKTGAARVALTTGCPVIPIAQWGPQDILRPYTKRPHVLGRKVMHVTAGPPVDLDDLRGRPITSEVLRLATDRIMAVIRAQLVAIRGEEPPAEVFDARTAGVTLTGRPQPQLRGAAGDPEVSDPEVSDPEVSDPEVSDPEVSDTEVSDPEVSDTEVSDTEVSDTEVGDTEVGDTEVSDPEVSDPEVADPAPKSPPAAPLTTDELSAEGFAQ